MLDKKQKEVVYLYSELMPYQVNVLNTLMDKYNCRITVFCWDKKRYTPFFFDSSHKINVIKRSEVNVKEMIEKIEAINPDIIYISGWMDFGYLLVVAYFRRKEKKVIVGFDDLWKNTSKQIIASLFFPFIYKFFFTHAWVAGPLQYFYARKLGFNPRSIMFNCLSADTNLFEIAFSSIEAKKTKYPHRMLYVGRFEYVKGVDLLVEAWKILHQYDLLGDWELKLIGTGSLPLEDDYVKRILIKPYSTPEELVNEAQDAGCFILPSRSEQWGVALHEFASAGLPIIASNVCGSNPVFLIDGYNGISCEPSVVSISGSILKIISKSDDELLEMSMRSHQLGRRINADISASSFISIIN